MKNKTLLFILVLLLSLSIHAQEPKTMDGPCDDLMFPETGSCPDVVFRLAVLPKPSLSDETETPPRCNILPGEVTVEIWATKYSPDPYPNDALVDPGIACAFVDLVMDDEPLSVAISFGDEFEVFTSGTLEGNRVVNLGGCVFGHNVGVWPKWVLVSRVAVSSGPGLVSYHLEPPSHEALGSSIVGVGAASVDFGSSCGKPVRPTSRKRNRIKRDR